MKLDLEEDEVYVFTPKGKVIALTANATPVDFAYAIHTEVGHRCIGAKVNGRLVPLDTRLNSADTVEIFTSKAPTAGPSRDWLGMVASSRARTKIRQWFSRERREDAIEFGREELIKELRREGLPVQKLASEHALAEVATAMNYADLDALHAAIGDNRVSARAVAQRILRDLRGGVYEEQLPVTARQQPTAPRPGRGSAVGVYVEGLDDLMVRLSRCCTPVPGRRDRRLRHPGPRCVSPPGRLRQRRIPGQPVAASGSSRWSGTTGPRVCSWPPSRWWPSTGPACSPT